MTRTRHAVRTREFFVALCLVLLVAAGAFAQSQKAPAAPSVGSHPDAEFLQTADSVLADMSKMLSLPVLEPLKKSIRSRDQIRDYLVKSMREDKDDSKRDADQKALEAFGLIPKGYPLQEKMLSLLTEQIAGLYDPKGREFFIADWTSPADQQIIMAHELTHALQDQHFHVQKWQDAAKANDDASMARDAVLEGSATVAMIDYYLVQRKILKDPNNIFDIPDLDPSLLLGDSSDSPELSSAPLAIREEMLFPYLSGFSFTQEVLKAGDGWTDYHRLFDDPPVSTQQILHPDLYLQGIKPQPVTLAPVLKAVPRRWKKLDENVVGEFFLNVIFKQFLGGDRADDLAPSWSGDRYALYEPRAGGPTLLIFRLRLESPAEAARFFGGYSEVLEKKHDNRSALLRHPNYFSFDTPDGGVFLRCVESDCLVVEGATREIFDAMTRSVGWSANPTGPSEPAPATPERKSDGKSVVVGLPGHGTGSSVWAHPPQPAAALAER